MGTDILIADIYAHIVVSNIGAGDLHTQVYPGRLYTDFVVSNIGTRYRYLVLRYAVAAIPPRRGNGRIKKIMGPVQICTSEIVYVGRVT